MPGVKSCPSDRRAGPLTCRGYRRRPLRGLASSGFAVTTAAAEDVSVRAREDALARAVAYFDHGGLQADLARRVALPTESQNPNRGPELRQYLTHELKPTFEIDFTKEKLGRAHHMKLGSKSLKVVTQK